VVPPGAVCWKRWCSGSWLKPMVVVPRVMLVGLL
jgi:hypothetical protein